MMKEFFESIKRRDPAARHWVQILLLYPGVQAVLWYRVAHVIYIKGFRLIAELLMYAVRCFLNIEIHPGAQIGKRLFIDHGTGVVIGETTVIGNDVTLYHGVTLGGTGKGMPGRKRHPTVKDGVIIGAGAKILGGVTLGTNCRVGANAVVLKDVPDEATAIGIPSEIRIKD